MLSSLILTYIYISGSKKKARTFDFMAMFEEAKKTAIERSQPSLGKTIIKKLYLHVSLLSH